MANHEVSGPRAPARRARLFRRDRRGSVLVVVALSMVAFVSMVALVVDLGMLLLAHSEAQRAADSAALAGASSFLTYDPQIQPTAATDTANARAMDYATAHTMLHKSIKSTEVTVQVVLDSEKVRVTVYRPGIPLIFARVFGIDSAGVSATAAAEADDAGAAPCVKPFAIPDMWAPTSTEDVNGNNVWDLPSCSDAKCTNAEQWAFSPSAGDTYVPRYNSSGQPNADPTGYGTDYRDPNMNGNPGLVSDGAGGTGAIVGDYGRRFAMKTQGGTNNYYPSYWFPWKLPGNSGANDYTTAIEGCQPVQLGDTAQYDTATVNIDAEKGNIGMPTYKAIEALINSNATYANETWDPTAAGGKGAPSGGINPGQDPRIITVALFNPVTFTSSSTKSMVFVDFANFWLEDPDVVNPGMKQKSPITARYLGRVAGSAGPNLGTLVKRLRLVE